MARQSDLRLTFVPEERTLKFDVVEFTLDEALSSLHELTVDLSSFNPAIDFGAILDRPALFTIWRFGQPVRHVRGYVAHFEQGETGFRRTRYRAVVHPELARLALNSDWRIFQQQSVPEILKTVLKKHRIVHYDQRVTHPHAIREYCVQAGETDLEFVKRLASEEGFYHGFADTDEAHSLIHCDRMYIHGRIAGGPVLYNATSGGDLTEPGLRRFTYAENVRTVSQVQRDYTFTHPNYDQEQVAQLSAAELGNPAVHSERYDYPGRYKRDESGKPFTRTRLLGLRRDVRVAYVEGDDARLVPGLSFDLADHPRDEFNRGWRPVRIRHHGVQYTSQEEENTSDQGTHYSYTAELIPDDVDWKPEPLPKPHILGPQVATVVGPPGEEIYCDEWGRVKVQFPWDRSGKNDDHSSCWIRVAQGWSGALWGQMAIPRIGQEVIVDYLDGDCDQPFVMGRAYNALNRPPYKLPHHKTRMTIKSQTHKGEGFNELRFEDESGQEEIYVHAQRDQNNHINHDETTSVGNDQTNGIGRDRSTNVGQDDTHSVGRDRKEHIRQDVFSTIDRNEIRTIGHSQREEIASSRQTRIGENDTVVIEGIQSIEAKTSLRTLTRDFVLQGTDRILIRGPAGSILFDQSGITLDSPNILFKGNVKVLTPDGNQVQAIEAAIREGSPLIEECPLKKED
ncbi:type VI secretion system Vgr family protein [Burkholderia sp. NLJ2]|uniref:type VI secretion system Vgr family protein n=1 Tax=Burkholderia sp. NLJ2 TaxID=3090699 RepID=UPI003C6C652B